MADSKNLPAGPDHYRGWLYKWTNYIKGYQKRWFVLQNGLLSYYRTQAEMAHTCRGTINLANAFIHTDSDSCTFVISNGGTQSFHLKASSEVERQKWVTALELAKAKAIKLMESDSDEDDHPKVDKNELQTTLRTLTSKLEDLNTCNDLIAKHGTALQKALSELEQLDHSGDLSSKIKSVNERATLFRITSNAMINACSDYLDLAQAQGRRWQRMLHSEHEQRMKLEEMVEHLAKQQASFENKVRKSIPAGSKVTMKEEASHLSSDEDMDFVDAVENIVEEFTVALPSNEKVHKRTPSGFSMDSFGVPADGEYSSESETECHGKEARVLYSKVEDAKLRLGAKHKRQASKDKLMRPASDVHTPEPSPRVQRRKPRRTTIPEKPNYSLNLWSIMKNCIGKELSKIPMPVNFSEPLSLLQRLTEDFEYTECLDIAARCEDSYEQMAYLAAFTISAYSTTTNRTSKPFNPLLGETYECDRMDDLGWRAISEQVSHHPPIAATHAEGRGWKLWQEFAMTSKFRGKYLQILPLGITHLEFTKTGCHFTWRKVTSTVHNIIVGRLWVDNHGDMDIINHNTGEKCHLNYSAYSYFSKEPPRKVTGVVTDKYGNPQWVLTGTWDDHMEGARILHVQESKGKPVFETGPHKLLWKRKPPPPNSEKMYNFTQLAIELNEWEDGTAPTDSRRRPDQRLMEEGRWDEANKTKVVLEERQRTARKKREAEAEKAAAEGRDYPSYEPLWFRQVEDKHHGGLMHLYRESYWQHKEKQDWACCPNIYG
ncbi:LOW QUALITY PROTEIN: oxysterol-binding protein 1-like [Liolophura sinensis]|uniref:LOW QUALITY PROTEIN: oxysterol-binding protein 1-like n=1 Tax=Liolophura sinensis TaxID=3198878 RepID=UPI0031592D39